MRNIVPQMLRQKAVYWPITGRNANGQPIWGTPIEIRCRWEDSQPQYQDNRIERDVTMAVAYVDRDVTPNGVMLLGALTSSVNQSDPKANQNAWEIMTFSKVPNLQGTEFLRTAFLGTHRIDAS